MDITPLIKEGQQIIQSYSAGSFKVNGTSYQRSIIVFTDQTIEWGFSGVARELQVEDFAPVIDQVNHLDVVLLGTGARMEFVSSTLKSALREKNITLDHMDTGAACRTYNVLMAEGRRVAAMLLPFV